MSRLASLLIVSCVFLLVFAGISYGGWLRLKFEDPADLNNFEAIDDGSRAERSEWIIYPVGTTPEPSPDGRMTEVGVLNQVTDNVKDDTAGDPGGPSGNDPVAGGYLLLTTPGATAWNNYVVSADYAWTDNDFFGLMFYYTDELNYYRFRITQRDSVQQDRNPQFWLERFVNGAYTELIPATEIEGARISDGNLDGETELHNLKVSVNNGTIELFLDSTSLATMNDTDLTQGSVAFFHNTCTGWIDNFEIIGDSLTAVKPVGKATTTWADIKAGF